MSEASVTGLNEARDFIGSLDGSMFSIAKRSLSKSMFAIQAEVKGNLTGSPMQSRTGKLANSIGVSVEGESMNSLEGRIFSNNAPLGVVYGKIHELGGTIKAKKAFNWLPGGPYLAIPTEANKTAAGVTMLTPTQAFQEAGAFVARGAAGWFIGAPSSHERGFDAIFVLRKRVEIPARLGMLDASESEEPNFIADIQSQMNTEIV